MPVSRTEKPSRVLLEMPCDLVAVPAEALQEGEAPREVLVEECGLPFSAQGGLGRVGGQIWEPELKASYSVKRSTPHATRPPPMLKKC